MMPFIRNSDSFEKFTLPELISPVGQNEID